MKSLHHNKSFGLFIIRLMAGIILIVHGYLKFADIAGTTASFESLGYAAFLAYVVAAIEFVGGISLVLGFGSRIAGGLLALDMLGAVLVADKVNGITGPGGAELALILFAVTLGVAIAGPGKYSLGSHCGCAVKKGTCTTDGGACVECGVKA